LSMNRAATSACFLRNTCLKTAGIGRESGGS
jgi:hypothetical protein